MTDTGKYAFSPSDFYTDGSKVDQITGKFGEPRANQPNGHQGLDISSRGHDGHTLVHKEFRTPLKGKIDVIKPSDWNTIQVTTPDGYTIQFLHGGHVYRQLNGQTVAAWTPLGVTGNVGPGIKHIHLHVQVFENGKAIDPENFFERSVKVGPQGQTARHCKKRPV